MGFKNLFSRHADLSGITTDAPLYVSQCFHKTFIKVNEEGTEAAAASAYRFHKLSSGLIFPLYISKWITLFAFLIVEPTSFFSGAELLIHRYH